jgi:hypothetical protein
MKSWQGLLKDRGRLALHAHNRWRNLYSLEGHRHLVSNVVRCLAGRSEWGDKYIPCYRGIQNMYIHVFSKRELTNLVHQAGFRIVELISLNGHRDGPAPLQRMAGLWANGFVLLTEAINSPSEEVHGTPGSA